MVCHPPEVAFIVSLVPFVGNVRTGNNIRANPVNLILAVVIFSLITMFLSAIIVDQYPCWTGVPNCD